MKAGKLSEAVLKRSVLKQLHSEAQGVLAGPGVGGDFAAVQTPDGSVAVSATETRCLGSGAYSVYAAVNNLSCSGARPIGVSVNILMPTVSSENDLRDQIKAIDRACEELDIAVLGGHTEVVRSVTEPIVTVTALGFARKERLITGHIEPDMDIIATKWIGLEGTAFLARERERELRSRYSQPFLDQAKCFDKYISVLSEAAVAAQSGACAMHDISEGGVFGALREFGLKHGVGLEIDLKKIPIRQETVEICEFFDLNPYRLLSGGSLLIAASDGSSLLRAMEKAGINAVIIGNATKGNDRIIRNGEEIRYIETTQTDELWKLDKEK